MAQKPFTRATRISNKIKLFLSDLIARKINDKRLENVTITDVKMSSDLRNAYIYFCIYGDKKTLNKRKQKAEDGFKSAEGFLKTKLAKELKLRFVPNLKFYYDTLIDSAAHINELIEKTKSQDEE